jgi:hypothetical protein
VSCGLGLRDDVGDNDLFDRCVIEGRVGNVRCRRADIASCFLLGDGAMGVSYSTLTVAKYRPAPSANPVLARLRVRGGSWDCDRSDDEKGKEVRSMPCAVSSTFFGSRSRHPGSKSDGQMSVDVRQPLEHSKGVGGSVRACEGILNGIGQRAGGSYSRRERIGATWKGGRAENVGISAELASASEP